MTAAIVVGSVGAHAGASHPVFAESNSRCNAAFFEGTVLLVDVEFVWLRVVGNQDVRPAIAIYIENGDSQTLRRGIAEPCLLRGIFEFAGAKVTPEPERSALVGLWSAVRFVRTVERAVKISLLTPLHVICNY